MAVMSAMPFITSAAGAQPEPPSAGPSGVHVAFGEPPHSALSVGWTGIPAASAGVMYRSAEADEWQMASAAKRPVPGERTVAYVVDIDGLAPSTEYEYRAVMDGTESDTFSATTAPEPTGQPPNAFTVTAVGDHGIFDHDNPVQRVQDDDPEQVIDLAEGEHPDLHICVGDISYANGHPSTWERYFSAFEDFYGNTQFMTVPGNHETEPGTGFTQYDRRLNDLMPFTDPGPPEADSKQRWYDFQYANTLFVGLNSSADACIDAARAEGFVPIDDPNCQNEDLPVQLPESQERTYESFAENNLSGEEQANYIEETLRAAERDPSVTWKVVYIHGPLWTSSPNHPDRRDLRRLWGKHFHEYNVDLVLHGDNHIYERTKPIPAVDRVAEVGEIGTTYLTNGTGGTSHYPFAEPKPDFTAFRDREHFGVSRLDVVDALGQEAGTEDASFPSAFAGDEAIVVRYRAYPANEDLGDDEFPIDYGEDDDVDASSVETVDEFAIVKDENGKPRQINLD